MPQVHHVFHLALAPMVPVSQGKLDQLSIYHLYFKAIKRAVTLGIKV